MAYINMAAVSARTFRSDRLGPLDSVAHPIAPGAYRGEVWRDDQYVGTFAIEAAGEGSGEQIDVDLGAVGPEVKGTVLSGGAIKGYPLFAVFHCEGEAGGLSARLAGARGDEKPYDTRRLRAGDYYMVTPVQPGEWQMRTSKGAIGTLIVHPAKPDGKPRASQKGGVVKVDDKGFGPDKIEIVAGDGVVFEIGGDDLAVAITLSDKPRGEDVPKPGRRPVGSRIVGSRAVRRKAAAQARKSAA